MFKSLGRPAGLGRLRPARLVSRRAAETKQRPDVAHSPASSQDALSDEEKILALESVDMVPLPGPMNEDIMGANAISLEAFTSLEQADDKVQPSGFNLDKTQSFWLLNVVSFLYGTNTTCAQPVCRTRGAAAFD